MGYDVAAIVPVSVWEKAYGIDIATHVLSHGYSTVEEYNKGWNISVPAGFIIVPANEKEELQIA